MATLDSDKPTRLILDPRTKLLLLLLVNVLMYSYGSNLYLWAAVAFAALLLLLAGAFRPLVALIIFYTILYAIDFVMGFAPPNVRSMWAGLSLSFFIFLPFFMYSILLFATTSIGDAAAAFSKWRTPNFILIPLLVLFRFIPTIRQEFRAITNAMRLRGAVGNGNPLKTIEYIYVPLLLSLVKTGEELTLASLTRGLGLHPDRTYINNPTLKWYDFAALLIMLLLILGRRGVLGG
ncbi:MAG: energy-coupling factor transporter transmembrane component T [Chloroflexota bacterium]